MWVWPTRSQGVIRVKEHSCPTCGQSYGCPRGEADCGSPHVFDCHGCYQRRYRKELKALGGTVAARFGDDIGCAGYGDFCYAH
jgi:hypothetical protein